MPWKYDRNDLMFLIVRYSLWQPVTTMCYNLAAMDAPWRGTRPSRTGDRRAGPRQEGTCRNRSAAAIATCPGLDGCGRWRYYLITDLLPGQWSLTGGSTWATSNSGGRRLLTGRFALLAAVTTWSRPWTVPVRGPARGRGGGRRLREQPGEAGIVVPVARPVRHLWSLAVEEQSYLAWPGPGWCGWPALHAAAAGERTAVACCPMLAMVTSAPGADFHHRSLAGPWLPSASPDAASAA